MLIRAFSDVVIPYLLPSTAVIVKSVSWLLTCSCLLLPNQAKIPKGDRSSSGSIDREQTCPEGAEIRPIVDEYQHPALAAVQGQEFGWWRSCILCLEEAGLKTANAIDQPRCFAC